MKKTKNIVKISAIVACCCLMAQDAVVLDPVIVTATRTQIDSSKAPGSFSILTKEQIKTTAAKNFKEVLASTESVYVKKAKGLMDSTPLIVIRGIPGAGRNLIMLDGIALNDTYAGSFSFLSSLNMQDVDRVEIVRGPFSSLYGTNAMGGAINFITAIPDKPTFEVSLGYGDSFKKDKANKDLTQLYLSGGGAIGERARLKVSYGDTRTDGYVSDYAFSSTFPAGTSGAIETTDSSGKKKYMVGDYGYNYWKSKDLKVKGEYDITDVDMLKASFMHQEYRYGYDNPRTYLKDAAGNSVYKPDEYTYLSNFGKYKQYIYGIGYIHKFDTSNLSLNYAFKKTKGEYSSAQRGATINGGLGKSTPNDQERHMLTALYEVALNDANYLLLGASYDIEKATSKNHSLSNWKKLDSKTKLLDDVGGRSKTLGLFTNLSSKFGDSVSTELGVRYDRWKLYNGYSKDYVKPSNSFDAKSSTKTSLSPKASLTWEVIDGTKFKTSLGKAFRAPGVYNLYKKWSSSTTTYFPNPELKPETSVSYDIGIEQEIINKGLFKIYYFHNIIKDMVYSKTSTDPSLNANKNNRRDSINAGKAKTYGYEISLNMPLKYGFDLTTNYTKTYSKMLENEAAPASVGKRLKEVPLDMYNFRLGYDRAKFYGSVDAHYVSKVYNTDINNDTVSGVIGSYDSYVLWNTKVGYRITKNFGVSLEVHNLFDKEYFSYYKAPGRSWMARIDAKF
ncbi:TonB-dependent receptor [Campylobacter sp.]|uniref:TonB-dependent receptor n=1 Tax=Campylobacter sp. TaxID=205 RepID=UPI00270F26D2|nr:TonB-dependent receptor [Campylobacter sp.]